MQDLVTELGMLGGGRGRSTRKLKCLSLWISVEYRSVSQFLVVDHEFSLGICNLKMCGIQEEVFSCQVEK